MSDKETKLDFKRLHESISYVIYKKLRNFTAGSKMFVMTTNSYFCSNSCKQYRASPNTPKTSLAIQKRKIKKIRKSSVK